MLVLDIDKLNFELLVLGCDLGVHHSDEILDRLGEVEGLFCRSIEPDSILAISSTSLIKPSRWREADVMFVRHSRTRLRIIDMHTCDSGKTHDGVHRGTDVMRH